MFYLLAGFGAIESGANKVMIPENGQGSIGGSLIVTGHEAKHRSCYPGFTAKLSRFVEALTGKRVKFYHPALFETKGAVLRALSDAGEDVRAVLGRHRSCSCDARLTSRDKQMFHCGVCGNCLLRRAAEHSANLDGATEYLFEDLSADTLESALRSGDGEVKMRFFYDLARNGARDMQRLADLVSASNGGAAQVAAVDLGRFVDGGIENATSSLTRLLNCHAAEWGDFLATCGENSWISRTARG
ncbi:adenine nucleotide alpha hydrolase family protein [Burkholderia cepacia]|uniref:7-cyano-7-deazaguanine synthase n=1 Tax=Burkholderia cepacia TaxID=292 RepID=UPI001CF47680|nr:7-cyano-7-deazaguanine synthase [Burkholderia cepacia]MCA8057475.1 7-cyano-7-deazaguanine synthase [Burkholderia cepacia]MCA8133546.1 7-cyano-7-deazaguanine synthase [Burkholderia cepacia]